MSREEMMCDMSKRNVLVDAIKGIAIFLMVFAHQIQYGTGDYFPNGIVWNDFTYKAIYSFHMPLFASVSGYLFYSSVVRKGFLVSVISRIKKLMPVIIGWVPILLVIGWFLEKNEIKVTAAIWLFLTDFWFLWTIIISSVLLFLTCGFKNEMSKIYVLIVLVLFLVTPDYSWISSHKFMFVFYYLGYRVAEKNLLSQLLKINVFIITSILWGFLLFFYNEDCFIYTTGYSLLGKTWHVQLGIDVYRIGIAICGCIMFVNIIKLLLNVKKNPLRYAIGCICWMGKNSLGIYVLSSFIGGYIFDPFFRIHVESYFSMLSISLVETICIMIMCYVMITIINMNKVLSKFLIGS